MQVEAGINQATGQVYANFYSLDPGTSLPPSVLTGFLPPEDGTGRGMGYVSYSIAPRAAVPTGTVIASIAHISFDNQPVIATNQIDPHDPASGISTAKEARVTIDSGAPARGVQTLPATSPASFTVTWAGNDDAGGSGIANFDVYVSDNGAPFILFRDDTTDASAVFTGADGHTYAFFAVAQDNVGNTQALPTAAQTTTTVDAVAPTLGLIVSRKTHGGAGTFDLPLSAGSPATIEPRIGGPDTLVFTFSENIKAAAGPIGALNFTIANAAFNGASLSGNTLTLNLSGAVDQSVVSVALNGMTDVAGNALTGLSAFGIPALYGDVNQSGSVSVSDLQGVKNHLVQTADATNYLFDVNASGSISVSDLQAVKNNLLHTVPAAAPAALAATPTEAIATAAAAPTQQTTASVSAMREVSVGIHAEGRVSYEFIGPVLPASYADTASTSARQLDLIHAIHATKLVPPSWIVVDILTAAKRKPTFAEHRPHIPPADTIQHPDDRLDHFVRTLLEAKEAIYA